MPNIAVRVSDEQLATIDEAIRRTEEIDDTLGRRSDYMRAAALAAAETPVDLRTVTARYRALVLRMRPRLTPPEWRLICDALNGIGLMAHADHGAELAVSCIPYEVADAIRLNRLDAKWLVEETIGAAAARIAGQPHEQLDLAAERGADLVRRLGAMSWGELLAIAHVAETFWARPDESAVPGEEGWREAW